MNSRSGQSDAKTRDFDADVPERESDHIAQPRNKVTTDHDAAPAAISTATETRAVAAGTGDTPEALAFWVVLLDGEQADNEWTYRTREAAEEAAAYILSHAPDAAVRVLRLVPDHTHGQHATPGEGSVQADEIERLRLAIRRLAEQDATLSVQGGNVIVELDATLASEERRAIQEAAEAYESNNEDADCERIAATLRGLLARTSACGNRQ
jgi:plasmid stabilization system protein ParE